MAARFALKSTHATSSSAIAKRRKQKQKLKLKLKKQQKKPQQKPSLVDLSHYQRFVASPLPRTLRFPLPPAFLLDPSLPELSLDPRDLLLCSDSLCCPHDAFAACAEKLMESKLEIMASRMRPNRRRHCQWRCGDLQFVHGSVQSSLFHDPRL